MTLLSPPPSQLGFTGTLALPSLLHGCWDLNLFLMAVQLVFLSASPPLHPQNPHLSAKCAAGGRWHAITLTCLASLTFPYLQLVREGDDGRNFHPEREDAQRLSFPSGWSAADSTAAAGDIDWGRCTEDAEAAEIQGC